MLSWNTLGFTWGCQWLWFPGCHIVSSGQGQLSDMNSPVKDDSSYVLTCDSVGILLFQNKTTDSQKQLIHPQISGSSSM